MLKIFLCNFWRRQKNGIIKRIGYTIYYNRYVEYVSQKMRGNILFELCFTSIYGIFHSFVVQIVCHFLICSALFPSSLIWIKFDDLNAQCVYQTGDFLSLVLDLDLVLDTQCRTSTVTYKKQNMHTGFCGRFNLLNDMFSFIFAAAVFFPNHRRAVAMFLADVNFIIFILFWRDVIGG